VKLNLRPIEIDSIITNEGTQVREKLDEAWVLELMELYRDEHEIEPILVAIEVKRQDGGTFVDGRAWLVDGFHRLEAQRRLGWTTAKATVRAGTNVTLDFARMLAAEANKNGRPLQPGDKRRAVLMARSTSEGAKMGVRELARHCGVAKSYVDRILGDGECPLGDTSCRSSNRSEAAAGPRHAQLHQRAEALLRADPGRTDTSIAVELDCDERVVRNRRRAMGLPKSDPSRWRPAPQRDAAEALLRNHPEWTNAKVAESSGSSPETVARLRDKLGIPSRRRGPAPKDAAPSAPPRKGGDVRDAAEVLQAHPQAPPPLPPSYASSAERDTAKPILDGLRIARGGFGDVSWNLLLHQIDEIIHVRSPEK